MSAAAVLPEPLLTTWRMNGSACGADESSSARLTLGDFGRALARAGLADNRPLALPGAAVVLPEGVRLFSRFAAMIAEEYAAAGLSEYEYPSLAPVEAFGPLRSLLDVRNRMLYAASDDDLAAGTPRAVLTPSGEAVFYWHWKTLIRSAADLPLRAWRRARYFRNAPAAGHSGRGIFSGVESADVFELHCAHATREAAHEDLRRLLVAYRRICERAHIPVFWSTRPPWGNRHEIAEWAVAGDAPLPTGATVQVASLYAQGDRWARAYRLSWRESGVERFAHQVSGAVSRRLAYVHLMAGLKDDGDFLVHPELAPDQIAIFARGSESEQPRDAADVNALAAILRSRGLRVSVDEVGAAELRRRDSAAAARGVPVRLTVFFRRHEGDRYKVLLASAHAQTTETELTADLASLAPRLEQAVADVGHAYDDRVAALSARARCHAGSLEEAQSIMSSRRVAVVPMHATAATMNEVARWRRGEVLGFCSIEEERRCVFTQETTRTVGLLSPRV